MAQIEILAGGERAAWSETRIAFRRSHGRRSVPGHTRTFVHEGRSLLLPMTGWTRAGDDGALRASPMQFR